MKSIVENISSVQRRVKLTVPKATVNQEFEKTYKKLQKKSKIQGFRDGKAPLFLIKKLYKDQAAYEVSDALVKSNLFDVIKKHNVPAISMPQLEGLVLPVLGSDYEFSAVVDIAPTIAIEDHYKNLEISCKQVVFTDALVESELKKIARKQAVATSMPEETAAHEGCLATISHTAMLDGKPISKLNVSHLEILLGEQEVFLDLEKAVCGMKKGEQKDVLVQLPTDYQDSTLAGKSIDFTISMLSLANLKIPAIDAELAKDLKFDSLEGLKEAVKKNIEASIISVNREVKETALLSELEKTVTAEIPPVIVNNIVDKMIDEAYKNNKNYKQAKTDTSLRKQIEPEAYKRAKLSLVLQEIQKKEDITITDEEVRSYISSSLKISNENDDKVTQLFESNKAAIKEQLIYRKTMDTILRYAKVTTLPSDNSSK